MLSKHKLWVIGAFVFLLVLSLLTNKNLKNTLARRRAIHQTRNETTQINEDIQNIRKRIDQLQNHPESYEFLVRRDLGYIRPGEKEVRFIRKKSMKKE